MKRKQLYANEWEEPIQRGYKLECCDCGLVHTMDFKVVVKNGKFHLTFRARRNERETKLARKRKKSD